MKGAAVKRRVNSAKDSGMKEKRTGESSVQANSNRKRLRLMSDVQIRRAIERDPEVRPTDAEFWKKARVVIPAPKQTTG